MKFQLFKQNPYDVDYDERTGRLRISKGNYYTITATIKKNLTAQWMVSKYCRRILYNYRLETLKHPRYTNMERIVYLERINSINENELLN